MRGLIRELFALIALIAGVVAAAWNYVPLAARLTRWLPDPSSARIAAFLLLVLGVVFLVLVAGRLVRSAAHLVGLGLPERLAGAAFGLARASLLAAAILMACTTLLPPQPAIEHSRLAPSLLRVAHLAASLGPMDLQNRISVAMSHFSNSSR